MRPVRFLGDGADPMFKIRPMDLVQGPMTEAGITIYEARLIVDALGKIITEETRGRVRIGRVREYDTRRDRFVCAASRDGRPYDHVFDGDEIAAHVRFFRAAQGVVTILPLGHKMQNFVQRLRAANGGELPTA